MGHDTGAVLTSLKNAHNPHTNSMVNGILKIQNWSHIGIMFWKLTAKFAKITFSHIPQKGNQMTDALTTISSMFKITWSNHEPRITNWQFKEPAHCLAIKKWQYNKPWFHDILKMPPVSIDKLYKNYSQNSFKVTIYCARWTATWSSTQEEVDTSPWLTK